MRFPMYQSRVAPPTPVGGPNPEAEQYEAMGEFGIKVGQAGAQFFGRLQQVEDSRQYNQALTEAKKRFGEWYMSRETDENFLTFNEQFQEYAPQLREEMHENLKSPRARRAFDESYNALAAEYELNTKQLMRAKSIQAGQAQLTVDLEQMIEESDEAGINARINGAVADDLLDPKAAEVLRMQAVSRSRVNVAMVAGRVMGYEEAIPYFATPEAGTEFGLNDDERMRVSSKLQTEWARLQVRNKQMAEEEMWDAYKRIDADDLTELEQLDGYEYMSGTEKIRLGQYLQAHLDDLLRGAQGAAGGKSAWQVTDRDVFETQYLAKLVDPNETVESIRAWLNKYHGPDMAGNPQIGHKEWKAWYQEVEKWKDDPDHVKAALAGIAAQYDANIRQAETPAEKGMLVEEKANTLHAFRDEALEKNWGHTELQAAQDNITAPLEEANNDKLAVRVLQAIGFKRAGRNPEELMAQWARAGRLDEYGRLVGTSEEEQLALLGLESFADLDFTDFQKALSALRDAGIDVEKVQNAPPEYYVNLFEVQANLESHEVLTVDPAGNWMIYNRINGTRYPASSKTRPQRVPTEPLYDAQEPGPVYASPKIGDKPK